MPTDHPIMTPGGTTFKVVIGPLKGSKDLISSDSSRGSQHSHRSIKRLIIWVVYGTQMRIQGAMARPIVSVAY